MTRKALFWFRRDLRIEDNAGLYHALKECDTVAPIFIFDKSILSELPNDDKRVAFMHGCVQELKKELNVLGSDIIVRMGNSEEEVLTLAKKFKVQAVYANEDYEPFGRQRDSSILEKLFEHGIEFKLYKDHVIFSKDELLDPFGQVFTVFTHYKNEWREKLSEDNYSPYNNINFNHKLAQFKSDALLSLKEIGFSEKIDLKLLPGSSAGRDLFERFKQKVMAYYLSLRDVPSVSGVSYLSAHNRFGTISIRYLVKEAMTLINSSVGAKKESYEAWLNELIWREFYMQIMYNYPHVIYEPFRSVYKNFPWNNDFKLLQLWCEGKTGYPIIDAAMKQLNETGYMHNRLRMIVSSFLTKDLLIDYRMGEAYFALKLIDYDLSANNGGWQWAASTGCDVSQYVRIFNPTTQSEKFDSEARFIKRYFPIFKDVPPELLHSPWSHEEELKNKYKIILGKDYPKPIVNHKERVKIALEAYDSIEKITN